MMSIEFNISCIATLHNIIFFRIIAIYLEIRLTSNINKIDIINLNIKKLYIDFIKYYLYLYIINY